MWSNSPETTPMQPKQPKPSGSAFWGGLTTGLLLGVAGYYFFGTKQGKVVRERMIKEWRKAEKRAQNSPVAETVSEQWQQVFGAVAKELGFKRQRHTAQKSKPLTRQTAFVKKTKVVKKSPAKFAGT